MGFTKTGTVVKAEVIKKEEIKKVAEQIKDKEDPTKKDTPEQSK